MTRPTRRRVNAGRMAAVDWDSLGRRETITVGNQSASLGSDFSQGAWVVFPISQAAGSTLTITVDQVAGPNAVLSGIFLGGGGTPPAWPVIPSQAPQGGWVGTYGSGGYDLAAWNGGSDVTSMPGVTVSVKQGSSYVWTSGTSDVRALEDAAANSRTASCYYDPNQIQLQLNFSSAYIGNLELYALDSITVGGQTAALSSDFGNGAWVVFPISQAAGSSLSVTVANAGPANAVLSGIFLGGGGSPPAWPPIPTQAPQGSWVGVYGAGGYDLAAWNGGSDVSSMQGVSVAVKQGTPYVWVLSELLCEVRVTDSACAAGSGSTRSP